MESEQRMALFMDRLKEKGLLDGKGFRLKSSQDVLGTFLKMNIFLLNLKKVSSNTITTFAVLTVRR